MKSRIVEKLIPSIKMIYKQHKEDDSIVIFSLTIGELLSCFVFIIPDSHHNRIKLLYPDIIQFIPNKTWDTPDDFRVVVIYNGTSSEVSWYSYPTSIQWFERMLTDSTLRSHNYSEHINKFKRMINDEMKRDNVSFSANFHQNMVSSMVTKYDILLSTVYE